MVHKTYSLEINIRITSRILLFFIPFKFKSQMLRKYYELKHFRHFKRWKKANMFTGPPLGSSEQA